MPAGTPKILVDARVNGLAGAQGIARSVMKLVAHCRAADAGLTLSVLINPDRPQLFPLSEIPSHVEIVPTDITLGAVHRCVQLARLVRAIGATVLYVPYPTFVPLIRPCPVVVTLHDCIVESSVRFAGGLHRQIWLKTATTVVLRRAAAVTAPSHASLVSIRQHYPSAPHPTLVPNGVDVSQFDSVTPEAISEARKLYQLPDQFILAVGAHRPHKNHETLVRALARLPGHVSLVIVGYIDRSFHGSLATLITRLALDSRVRLLPAVAERWLPAVYHAASAFAFPSLAEGFGLPVLEAMASGLPVVASDIPVMREVAGAGADLVEPRDVDAWARALHAVLTDPLRAQRLATAGSAVARNATWDRGGAALWALLAEIAASTARPVAMAR